MPLRSRVVHAGGLAGAREARGTVVVIDVLRAFTVTAYALGGGAVECRMAAGVEEALELSARIPGSVVSAEVEGPDLHSRLAELSELHEVAGVDVGG